jgi:exopolysaccharide biosynthesis polyprenyl glycosylphosphotransferase
MLRDHAKAVERAIAATDLMLIIASLVIADLVMARYELVNLVTNYGLVMAVFCTVWYALLRHAGFYRSLRTRGYPAVVRKVLQTAVLGGVLNAAVLFVAAPHFSRRVYVAHLALATLLLLGWKLAIRAGQKAVRRRGYNYRRILVAGTGDDAVRFIRHVEEHREWGFEIVGCVQGVRSPQKDGCAGYPVLGRLDTLVDVCKARPVDEIILTLPAHYVDQLEEIIPRLEAMGTTVRLALDYYRPQKSRVLVGFLGDEDPIPVVTYHRAVLDPTQLVLKRLLDVVGSLVGVALTALLLPAIAAAIKLDSPGPVFFRQKRVGQNGRIFSCYKFRTMYVDAEARKKDLLARNEMTGAIFKIKDDPRITRVGRFLRKTSLDELPQFWNVLSGEMSLVGTRPPTPDEVEHYEEWQRGRICIKPGLTGLWQTSGRNHVTDFDEICRLDLRYIDNWSLWLDIKLLAKTVGMVAFGVGAS